MAINSLSASSNGFSGLASGLDTESMVEQLLSGTQSKIDSTNQKITQLEYKQELYQSVISDLRTFQNTYFSYTNQESNLLSQSFFTAKSVSSTSKAYSVTANSSANVGSVTVNKVSSLATNYKQTAKKTASAQLSGTFDLSLVKGWKDAIAEEKLTVKVGDKSVDIDVKDIAGKGNIEIQDIINEKLVDENGESYAEVNFLNGKLKLTAKDDSAEITVSGSDTAVSMLGLKSGKTVTGKGSAEMTLDSTAVLPTVTIEVDGVSKDIKLDPYSGKGILTQLNDGIKNAFGDGIHIDFDENAEVGEDGKVDFKIAVENSSRKVTVTGDEESLAMLGIKNRASNKISLTTSLSNAQFGTAIIGDQHKFTINGVDFSFSSDATISSIMTEINNSDAGVKVSYSSTTDKFTIESKTTGSRTNAFEISQSEGNLLTAMFGVPAADNFSGMELKKTGMTEAQLPADFSFKGGKVNLTLDDKTIEIDLSDYKADSAQSLVTRLNSELSEYFKAEGKEDVSVKFEIADGKVTLTSTNCTATVDDDSLKALGFDSAATADTKLSELGIEDDVVFTIGGEEIKITADTTLQGMVDSINSAAALAGNSEKVASLKGNPPYIRLCGVDIPMQFIDVSGKLFGTTEKASIGQAPAAGSAFDITEGKDAKITINGVEVVRSTNTFTVDGLTFNLTAETDEASTIGITQDTDKIYDTVLKFVDDYNKLVNTINGLLDAEATYRDYDPLTTAQEEEMTESQIEKWNEKAKEGLLRNDSTLTTVLSSLRQTLYTKPEGGMALYELGITTSYFGTKDNLTIEDKSELKSKIAENPDAVMKLFTDSSKGLATLLNNAVDGAAKSSISSPGTLVRMAGSKGVTDTSSSIYKQTKELKEKLSKLEDQYESEYDRYWKQFNSMESYISQMNSTSAYLTSFTNG